MDNQNQQRERRKGAVDYINSLRSVNLTLRTVGQIVTKPFPWVWIVVIIILLIVIFQLFFGGGTGFSLDLDDSQNPNLPGGSIPGSGNISSCIFYRGGDSTQGLSFGNPQMAALVSDVSTQVGVPPAIVAGIMRVESGGAIAQTDPSYLSNDYDAHCSSANACGVMQITSSTFTGVFNNNREEMNTLFAKTGVSTAIVPQNSMESISLLRIYSIKDSIIAAAFLVKSQKQSINGSGPWDENTVREIASSYFSGGYYSRYPDPTAGPFDYGDDLWRSYQNCQTAIIAPAPPANIRQGLIDSFGITMDGFGEQHLRWAWEKFYETSNTRFPGLVRGITIAASDGGSSQLGCAGSSVAVRLRQYTPGDFFKFMLTHELGHVIQSCLPRAQSRFTDAINAYSTEGGISFYANTASSCNGTVNVNENYADIIAYYLNPNAGLASGPRSCGGPANPPNPFFSGQTRFPLHFSVAEGVLK